MVENIASSLANVNVSYKLCENELFIPSARTSLVVDGEKVGEMGIIHPMISSKIDQKKVVSAIELDFNKFMKFSNAEKTYKKVSKYQAVDMDFNFLVPSAMKYAELESIISEFRCKMNVEYKLKDVYENKEVLGDKKSMTLRFGLASMDHTLSGEEIENFRKEFEEYIKRAGLEIRA